MQLGGRLHGAKLLRFGTFPVPGVLGPDAAGAELEAMLDRHGMVFVKPTFKGAIGKRARPAVAVTLSMIVLMVASFVEAHPAVKILALGFLIMIGMALVADGLGAHVPKGYIYTAMVFSVFIELIDMRQRRKARPVHLRNPYGAETEGQGDERQALEEAGMPGARASGSLR
jgi:hypothetical protein